MANTMEVPAANVSRILNTYIPPYEMIRNLKHVLTSSLIGGIVKSLESKTLMITWVSPTSDTYIYQCILHVLAYIKISVFTSLNDLYPTWESIMYTFLYFLIKTTLYDFFPITNIFVLSPSWKEKPAICRIKGKLHLSICPDYRVWSPSQGEFPTFILKQATFVFVTLQRPCTILVL